MRTPLELCNDALVFIILVVAVTLVIIHRHRILFLLTGDDRVHADVHSSIWSALTCCRMCTGEWTRHVSACLCFWHKGLRGRNLKRAMGQMLGLVPIPIRFSNILVGDLPVACSGDFYVAIEVGESPVQITSVAEDANPKVVQFEETLIMRVRNSPAEFSIRISVRQLHTFGCKDLCECYISPMQVASWAWRQKGPMRFKMEPLDNKLHLNFPPWILVEIMPQPEYGTARPFEAPAVFDVQLTELTTRMTSHFRSPASFKHHYTLLSTHGHKADEPDEESVGALDAVRRRQVACSRNMCFILLLISSSFLVVRYYSFACVYEFEKVAMLSNFVRGDFPVPADQRTHLLLKCEMAEPAVLRLVRDFGQHSSEGSQHLRGRIENATGVDMPGGSVASALSNMTRHAVHHGSHLATAAGGLAQHVANATGLKGHVANLTDRVRNVDGSELAAGLGEHLSSAAAGAVHHGSRAVHAAADLAGDAASQRRLEAPARQWAAAPQGSPTEEEALCSPSMEDILAMCKELPFGEGLPVLPIPVFGLFSIPVPCVHGHFCEASMHVQHYDFPFLCFLIGWACVFFCSRKYFAHRISVLMDHHG